MHGDSSGPSPHPVPRNAPARRRAAQVLCNLAEAPECHDAIRQHEWMLMHFAMSDPTNAGPLTVEVLEILNSH